MKIHLPKLRLTQMSLTILILVLASCSPPQPSMVDVGGHRLFIHCVGQGSPVIVLDTGTPGDASNLAVLLTDLQHVTRTCVYDRSGLGASDPREGSTTSQQIVDDLHVLLSKANVMGPYVLVGWSFGGMNMRLYAHQYPDEVVGLVLLDSSHPDQFARFLEALPPASPSESPTAQDLRVAWADNTLPSQFNFEDVDWATSSDQVRDVQSLGTLPLVVITAGVGYWPDFPPDEAAILHEAWQSLQRELVQLSSHSLHIIATESNHCIHCSEPRLVIDAIREIVKTVRSQ